MSVIVTPNNTLSIGTIDTNGASSNGLSVLGSIVYAQSASVSDPGMVNLTTQSFSGNKTFTGSVTLGPSSSSTAIHQINGGLYRTTRTITGNLTVDTTTTDDIIFCNNSSSISITLPTPTKGRTLVIKDIAGTAGTNNITIIPAINSTQIEGLAVNYVFQTNYGSIVLSSDGTNWWMI